MKLDNLKIVVLNLNNPLSVMKTTQKISKHKENLNNTINQDLGICRMVCLMTAGYTFFPSEHETASKIHYTLCHKTTSVNLKVLKLYKVYSPTTMESFGK